MTPKRRERRTGEGGIDDAEMEGARRRFLRADEYAGEEKELLPEDLFHEIAEVMGGAFARKYGLLRRLAEDLPPGCFVGTPAEVRAKIRRRFNRVAAREEKAWRARLDAALRDGIPLAAHTAAEIERKPIGCLDWAAGDWPLTSEEHKAEIIDYLVEHGVPGRAKHTGCSLSSRGRSPAPPAETKRPEIGGLGPSSDKTASPDGP